MSNNISIRQATLADAADIAQFNINMAWETEEKKLNHQKINSGVRSLLKSPEYGFYIVAEINSNIIASLMVTKEWSDWRDGLFWWIQSVYVTPDFRRQGVYRSMYQFIKKLARSHPEVCGCRLYVEKDNSVAQSTYGALGMAETHYKLFEEEFE